MRAANTRDPADPAGSERRGRVIGRNIFGEPAILPSAGKTAWCGARELERTRLGADPFGLGGGF